MGKKPAPKPKAKTKTEAELKAEADAEAEAKAKAEARRIWQQRKDATKWTQAQIDALMAQREKAVVNDGAWLEEPHKWHENKLKKLLQRFELKLMDELPEELKEGITAYVSQCADGVDGKQEGFKDNREMYGGLPELPDDDDYERAAQSPEAVKAAEEILAWTDVTEKGMLKFVKILREHAVSAAVQEAGLTRVGFLMSEEAKDDEAVVLDGKAAEILMPAIEPAMREFLKDPDVQRKGCAAIRGLALTKGQVQTMCDKGAAERMADCLRVHLKNSDIVLAATAAVWAMAQAAGKNSPELSAMRTAGIIEIFKKVMTHHAWDQTLCGKVRVVLPFLAED